MSWSPCVAITSNLHLCPSISVISIHNFWLVEDVIFLTMARCLCTLTIIATNNTPTSTSYIIVIGNMNNHVETNLIDNVNNRGTRMCELFVVDDLVIT